MLHWWQRQKEKRGSEKEKAKKCRPRVIFMGYVPSGTGDPPPRRRKILCLKQGIQRKTESHSSLLCAIQTYFPFIS